MCVRVIQLLYALGDSASASTAILRCAEIHFPGLAPMAPPPWLESAWPRDPPAAVEAAAAEAASAAKAASAETVAAAEVAAAEATPTLSPSAQPPGALSSGALPGGLPPSKAAALALNLGRGLLAVQAPRAALPLLAAAAQGGLAAAHHAAADALAMLAEALQEAKSERAALSRGAGAGLSLQKAWQREERRRLLLGAVRGFEEAARRAPYNELYRQSLRHARAAARGLA